MIISKFKLELTYKDLDNLNKDLDKLNKLQEENFKSLIDLSKYDLDSYYNYYVISKAKIRIQGTKVTISGLASHNLEFTNESWNFDNLNLYYIGDINHYLF